MFNRRTITWTLSILVSLATLVGFGMELYNNYRNTNGLAEDIDKVDEKIYAIREDLNKLTIAVLASIKHNRKEHVRPSISEAPSPAPSTKGLKVVKPEPKVRSKSKIRQLIMQQDIPKIGIIKE